MVVSNAPPVSGIFLGLHMSGRGLAAGRRLNNCQLQHVVQDSPRNFKTLTRKPEKTGKHWRAGSGIVVFGEISGRGVLVIRFVDVG